MLGAYFKLLSDGKSEEDAFEEIFKGQPTSTSRARPSGTLFGQALRP